MSAEKLRTALVVKFLGVAGLALLVGGCGQNSQPADPTLTIELRWVKGFSDESRSDVETGLLWTLSFLGATLPRGSPDPLSWRGDIVTLRLDRAGIDHSVRPHWKHLLAAMKGSDEYRRMGAFDIGRFVALTLCSSWHYYALTGAGSHYEAARARYAFDPRLAAIIESTVAHGDRLLELAQGATVEEIAFVGHEGTGSIRQRTFQKAEQELVDVMPNRQLRFALYGPDGALKPAATQTLTSAGKPSKCLWCHESQLLRPFDARSSVEGYYSPSELEAEVENRMARLRDARATMRSRIDFARRQDHTYAELLYLSFYEPSADRLAREWNLSVEQVQQMLSKLPTHAHHEFDFLGASLYQRHDVDALAPYDVMEAPTDPREPSEYEPNLLR